MRIAILCALGLVTHCLCAQQVSVWLTTDDQKSLMQSQPGVIFSFGASASIPTLAIDIPMPNAMYFGADNSNTHHPELHEWYTLGIRGSYTL